MKILKGDKVKILIGKDKGREGEVVLTLPKKSQVVVKGINIFKKHVKSQKNQAGGIIEKERPLAVSKLALLCPSCHHPARVGYQIDKSGDKFRMCRQCRALIDKKIKTK